MPRVQLSNTKGLFQKSGKGFEHIDSDSTNSIGFHRWVETLDIVTGVDNACLARVGMYIPAQARIKFAMIHGQELSTSGDGSVALQVHGADLALGATSGGVATEIVGADEAGNSSLPNTDLNIGSGDDLYDQISMGTLAPIDRGTAKSYFNLAAKETMTTLNGSPKVTVVIEWYGRPAVKL